MPQNFNDPSNVFQSLDHSSLLPGAKYAVVRYSWSLDSFDVSKLCLQFTKPFAYLSEIHTKILEICFHFPFHPFKRFWSSTSYTIQLPCFTCIWHHLFNSLDQWMTYLPMNQIASIGCYMEVRRIWFDGWNIIFHRRMNAYFSSTCCSLTRKARLCLGLKWNYLSRFFLYCALNYLLCIQCFISYHFNSW